MSLVPDFAGQGVGSKKKARFSGRAMFYWDLMKWKESMPARTFA
jgi:hypothetical protein